MPSHFSRFFNLSGNPASGQHPPRQPPPPPPGNNRPVHILLECFLVSNFIKRPSRNQEWKYTGMTSLRSDDLDKLGGRGLETALGGDIFAAYYHAS